MELANGQAKEKQTPFRNGKATDRQSNGQRTAPALPRAYPHTTLKGKMMGQYERQDNKVFRTIIIIVVVVCGIELERTAPHLQWDKFPLLINCTFARHRVVVCRAGLSVCRNEQGKFLDVFCLKKC